MSEKVLLSRTALLVQTLFGVQPQYVCLLTYAFVKGHIANILCVHAKTVSLILGELWI